MIELKKEERDTLICVDCKEELPITKFATCGKNLKTGAIQFRPRCRECNKKYVKGIPSYKKVAKGKTKRRLFIDSVKDKCVVCGYDKCKAALDLHHVIEEDKSFGIATMAMRFASIEEIKMELAKCVVLCSNCHREHHHGVIDVSEYPRALVLKGEK